VKRISEEKTVLRFAANFAEAEGLRR
jgi:hypothetical protein